MRRKHNKRRKPVKRSLDEVDRIFKLIESSSGKEVSGKMPNHVNGFPVHDALLNYGEKFKVLYGDQQTFIDCVIIAQNKSLAKKYLGVVYCVFDMPELDDFKSSSGRVHYLRMEPHNLKVSTLLKRAREGFRALPQKYSARGSYKQNSRMFDSFRDVRFNNPYSIRSIFEVLESIDKEISDDKL